MGNTEAPSKDDDGSAEVDLSIYVADVVHVPRFSSFIAGRIARSLRFLDVDDLALVRSHAYLTAFGERHALSPPEGVDLQRSEPIDLISACTSSGSRLVVTAEAGSGKTTSLQHAARTITSPASVKEHRCVLLIRLRDVVTFEANLRCLMVASLGSQDIGEASQDRLIEAILDGGAPLTVLLDGFDELSNERTSAFFECLDYVESIRSDASIVVTSRPDDRLRPLMRGRYQQARILPLTARDIVAYCSAFAKSVASQYSGQPEALLEILLGGLFANPDILEVVSRPLFIALYCGVVERESRESPGEIVAIKSKYDLLRIATRLMSGQREVAKDNRSVPLPKVDETRWILQALAKWMMAEGVAAVERGRVEERLLDQLQSLHDVWTVWHERVGDLLDLLISRTGILREFTSGQVEFIHKAFQDVLAGWEYQRTDAVLDLMRVYRDGRSASDSVTAAAAEATETQLRSIVEMLCSSGSPAEDRVVALRLTGVVSVMPPDLRQMIERAGASLLPPTSPSTLTGLAAVGEAGYRVLADWIRDSSESELLGLTEGGRSAAELVAHFLAGTTSVASVPTALQFVSRLQGEGGGLFASMLESAERLEVITLSKMSTRFPVLEWRPGLPEEPVADIGVVRETYLDRELWTGVAAVVLAGDMYSDIFWRAAARAATQGRLVGVAVLDVGPDETGREPDRRSRLRGPTPSKGLTLGRYVRAFGHLPLFAQRMRQGVRSNFGLEARLADLTSRYVLFARCRPFELRSGGSVAGTSLRGLAFDDRTFNSQRAEAWLDRIPDLTHAPREMVGFRTHPPSDEFEVVAGGVPLRSVREAWLHLCRTL